MTFTLIQNSLVAGELSPSLFGRTDIQKYHQGCSTMRNFFVNYRGGAASRAGLAYVGKCKQSADSAPPRDIPFQFNINQGYVLEFGDQYMRVKYRGAYVTEASNAITNITKANPGVFTYTNTNYTLNNGDWIFISGVEGMTNFNGLTWIVTGVSGSNFSLTDLFGNPIDTTTFDAYTSGGTLARIYTAIAPYAAVDLPFLKYTQSADTMSLTCVNQESLVEYPSYELVRFGNTNWVFSPVEFGASISPPTGVSSVAQSSTTLSTWYSYVVTAVDSATGDESVASVATSVQNNDISINAGSNTISWNAVAGASNYNIYKATPSYSVPVPVGSLYGFMGTAFGTQITDTNIIADFTRVPPTHQDPFARSTITSVNITNGGSGFTQGTVSYTITTSSGGGFIGSPIVTGDALVAFIIENGGQGYASGDTITIGTLASGTYTFTTNPANGDNIVLNGVTWTFVTGTPAGNQTKIHTTVNETLTALVQDLNASVVAGLSVASYTVSGLILTVKYKTIGTGGNAYTLAAGTYGGTVSAGTLTGGSSGGATATLTIGPATGTYPGVVAYYQQRRAYGYTLNQPDTYFLSQPGSFLNMDSSIPSSASDAIVGAPWAQQINGIQFMIPLSGNLLILTGLGAWSLNGGNNAAITPADQTATAQAYNGCSSHVQPVTINYNILYVQSKGSIVRDLSYNFFTNNYTGVDRTVFSSHLFNFYQIQQWAYAEEPYKIVWAIRDDGTMLSFTYLKEQEVDGWARHDTNGLFVGVCSITEPPVDAIYVITRRYVQGQGQWAYYSERMDNRNWANVEDCFCVDAGLTYPMTYPDAILTPAAALGTNNISDINIISGGSNYTAPVVTARDLTGEGTGATFSATVMSGVITAINILTEGEDYTEGTQLDITDSTGTGALATPIITNNVTFTTDTSVFTSDNVGDVIRIGNNNANSAANFDITPTGGGQAIITSYISGTEVIADIIQPITNIIPNDPFFTPVPVNSDQWSLSTPTTVVTGLNHLEGMQVTGLADGSVIPVQTVENGSITLQQAASCINVGLPFVAQLQTMYLDQPDQTTAQGKRKNLYAVTVRMCNSRGMSVGTNQPDQSTQPNNANEVWTSMREFKERNALINAGDPINLITGDERIDVTSDWNEKAQIAIQQVYPLSAEVEAIISEWSAGDTSG